MVTYQQILKECSQIIEEEMMNDHKFPQGGHFQMALGTLRFAHILALKFKCYRSEDFDKLHDRIDFLLDHPEVFSEPEQNLTVDSESNRQETMPDRRSVCNIGYGSW